MIKKAADLTEREKEAFYRASMDEAVRKYGISRSVMRQKIEDDLNRSFHDASFVKMDSDAQIDAAFLRRAFKEKPSVEDYVVWTATFVTHSDMIEIPDEYLGGGLLNKTR